MFSASISDCVVLATRVVDTSIVQSCELDDNIDATRANMQFSI